jgi:hypothetical protein
MPEPAPVTITTLPSNRMAASSRNRGWTGGRAVGASGV